jgi:hypothetical protein
MGSGCIGCALDLHRHLLDFDIFIVVVVMLVFVAIVTSPVQWQLLNVFSFYFLGVSQTSVAVLGASRANGSFASAPRLALPTGQTPEAAFIRRRLEGGCP